MLDGTVVPHWIHSILSEITTEESLDLSLVILNNGIANHDSTLSQRLRNFRDSAFGAYALIDSKFFAGKVPLNAFAPKDASGYFEGVPKLQTTPLQKRFV